MKKLKINLSGKKTGTELLLVLILAVLFVFFSIASPHFLKVSNLSNLLRQTSINGVVTMGILMVIISGGIDLSVGSTIGISVIVTAMLLRDGYPVWLAFLVAMVIGVIVGLFNGMLIARTSIPPFVITLGSQTIIRAVGMLITNSKMITNIPRDFSHLAQLNVLGFLPLLTVIWIVVIIITYIMSKHTVFGRNIYAVGSNKEAARLSGINVVNTVQMTFVFSGLTAALAGFILTARLGNGVPTAGTGYELDAITAAVVGGASMSGGEGTVLGAVLGAIIMSTLRQGGNLLGLNTFFMEIIIGALLIVAVWIDKRRSNR